MIDENVSKSEETPEPPEPGGVRDRRASIPAWSRRLAVAFAGVTVAFAVFEWMEWPFLRRLLESAMRYALECEVSIRPDFGVRFIGRLRLRAPLHIEGTFADPQVRLETAMIGLRLAAAAALATVTPVAALLALFDLDEVEKQACQKAFDRVQRSSRLPAAAPQRAR